jgi:cytochrome c peroxidase
MSPQELRGKDLFIGDAAGSPSSKDGECAHCHSFSTNKALFARNEFSNNGLDSVASLVDFLDYGIGGITNNAPENGMFREVSVRNVALTAPYMHDGRFQTLEEVLDHYVSGVHPAPNLASELSTATTLPQLTQNDKEDIIAFLHALTDTSYVNKEEWSNPFE